MAKHSKSDDLLKVLGQKAPSLTPAAPSPEMPRTKRQAPPVTARGQRKATPRVEQPIVQGIRGKAVQVYLHSEDEKIIRELAVWLAPHRKRINDSLVIKTVLRAAKTGPDLLAAYDSAVKVDGRTREKRRTRHPA
jgi:hypothetical protein